MIFELLEELRLFARVFGDKSSTMIARQIWKAERKLMKEYRWISTKEACVFFPEINNNDLFYALKGGQIVGRKKRNRYLYRTDSVMSWYKRLLKKRRSK